MRAVVLGLVGVLVAGAVSAGECRPDRASLHSGAKTFKVAAASSFVDDKSERVVLRGAVRAAPHVIDLQSTQGNSAFLTSYRGRRPDTGGMPVRWSQAPIRQLSSGGTIEVESGPLKGEWRVSCRS